MKNDAHLKRIGFGGGCHWCTEAYFQSLRGVETVEQGWISAKDPDDSFSEAIIVHYDPDTIPLKTLISLHLLTHSSTKMHGFRSKYRSAVYVLDGNLEEVQGLIAQCGLDFDEPVITRALVFDKFRLNTEEYRDYFRKNREGAFCKRYIHPKLEMIRREFATYVK